MGYTGAPRWRAAQKKANAALWQRRVIQERGRAQREIPPLLSPFSISDFGLFVRLTKLHEYRCSTRTD
jgi:hypothetical protein